MTYNNTDCRIWQSVFLCIDKYPWGYIFISGVMQMSEECCCRTKNAATKNIKSLQTD